MKKENSKKKEGVNILIWQEEEMEKIRRNKKEKERDCEREKVRKKKERMSDLTERNEREKSAQEENYLLWT